MLGNMITLNRALQDVADFGVELGIQEIVLRVGFAEGMG